ncbi:hypothetical protein H4219_006375 [Mycoemilia scoparia]|uniref:Uncharacterized protein n=1 Tax=Mycoemilia scoparia TaxID=417184 RepID=A0A9W7ZNT6_9FUNG|nr:hypothetical protein H4219_006375 [Mycoemilia scoparia]
MDNLTTLDTSTLLMTTKSLHIYNDFPKLHTLKIYLRSLVYIKKVRKQVDFDGLVVLEVRFSLRKRAVTQICNFLPIFPNLRVFKSNVTLSDSLLKELKENYPNISFIIDDKK